MPTLSIEMIGVVILSVVLAGVLVAYDRVLRKLQRQHHEVGKLEEEAQRRADKVLEEARIKATQILSEARVNGEQLQKQLAEMIDTVDKDHVGDYKERLQKLSEDIENNLKNEAEEFRKVLETETVTAQKTATAKMEGEYEKVQKELSEYKRQRLAEIEAGLGEALEVGLKKVAGEMITTGGHEELVMKALEEAKKENVFEHG